MADFEGIPLVGEGMVGGSLLILRTAPTADGIACLPGDVEVEIRKGIRAVVARGIAGSDYESVIAAAPELANKGLDIFAMTGLGNLTLEDVWLTHVVWWPTREAVVVRVWCSAPMTVGATAEGVALGPDGERIPPDVRSHLTWQESMRYFRMSEVTDDLFDAFRNVYLALESLLSLLEPPRVKANGHAESEKVWFKRALRKAAELVDLGTYLRNSTGDPVHDIYDELHNRVRNRVFHAKDGLQPFLPQDLSSRAQVAEAKERYGCLYLDLAGKVFRAHFPAGYQTRLGPTLHDSFKAITRDWGIAFTSDPAPVDVSEPEVSPGGEAVVTVPAVEFTDLRGDDFTALMARAAVPEVAAIVPAVGRVATVNAEGQLGLIESLEGRLTLAGFDRCEFVASLGVTGRKVRKALYAT